MWSSMIIESAIGAYFFSTTVEGCMGRSPFYMLRSGMSKICRRGFWVT